MLAWFVSISNEYQWIVVISNFVRDRHSFVAGALQYEASSQPVKWLSDARMVCSTLRIFKAMGLLLESCIVSVAFSLLKPFETAPPQSSCKHLQTRTNCLVFWKETHWCATTLSSPFISTWAQDFWVGCHFAVTIRAGWQGLRPSSHTGPRLFQSMNYTDTIELIEKWLKWLMVKLLDIDYHWTLHRLFFIESDSCLWNWHRTHNTLVLSELQHLKELPHSKKVRCRRSGLTALATKRNYSI